MSEEKTNLIKRASELNNHGALLIVQGELGRATAVFQSALAVMKNASTPVESQGRGEVVDHSQHIRAFRALVGGRERLPSNGCCIHAIPFVLEGSLIPNHDIALPLYSAIILFNLGLSLHGEALTGSEASLRRVSHIYRMSLQILESVSQMCPCAIVVAIAALNNKATIHFELCQYDESKRCWAVLSQLFESAQAVMHVALDAKAMERIFMNFHMANFPSAAGAA
ncbi:hypothetical protein FisN_4Hh580 [Fistulifera solaris]|jgi:hypothetical protein|uniref:CCR4-NOT transcription complex subunit 10 n=1 Tax=Fistulifera solaris TaxID=1519565 RepID=A0A1Z5K5P9_FISSO|nr:hypothetical protein FisN_4Hh580 [Fistulifera solaris]|eukprot:GAX21515.1 hypothetical protein FisN_4Hh580 [Fistulifera solaris]